MKRLVIFLYCIVPLVLIVSAVFDAMYGNQNNVFGSAWFFAMWTIFAFWGLLYIVRRRMWHNPIRFVVHLSLVIILFGAGITWLNFETAIVPFVGFILLALSMVTIVFSNTCQYKKFIDQSLSWNTNLLLRHKYKIIVAFVVLFQIVFWLVWLGIGKQTSPLSPDLRTPFLGFHVSAIIIAYSLFVLTLCNSVVALILNAYNSIVYAPQVENLRVLNSVLLYPATFLLGIGIGIGAIWANDAWGAYWSWDPKETCALITFLLYSGLFHTESVKKLTQPVFFHSYVIVAFLSVLITCFGVNILGGMHAY